eukprot:CAMPEP_0174842472 /NCGR_PEP_ID=MMETSP1114-20130205/9938_1 /TAXON_ID=312471 /ORGANISM="Neobodo designis, Strain CCAP 1951/1" /LENGTH=170 /DNA_ID=CAMNT_0016076677 /DNA_START=12 /DNA_END=520 /DNA_ORIENTATION=+
MYQSYNCGGNGVCALDYADNCYLPCEYRLENEAACQMGGSLTHCMLRGGGCIMSCYATEQNNGGTCDGVYCDLACDVVPCLGLNERMCDATQQTGDYGETCAYYPGTDVCRLDPSSAQNAAPDPTPADICGTYTATDIPPEFGNGEEWVLVLKSNNKMTFQAPPCTVTGT